MALGPWVGVERWSAVPTGLALALALSALCGRTQAQVSPTAQGVHAAHPHAALVATVEPCVPVDLIQFRRMLAAELGAPVEYQPAAPDQPDRTWVHLSCTQLGVEVLLEDGVTHKSMMRVLDTDAVEPSARTRLVALAVSEFVVASWVELRVVPTPAVPAARAPRSPPPQPPEPIVERVLAQHLKPAALAPAAQPDRRVWELGIGLGLDTIQSHSGLWPTLSLRLYQFAVPHVAIALGADAGLLEVRAVRQNTPVGTIDATRLSGLVGLLFGGELDEFALYAGPAARLGVLHVAGKSQLPALRENAFSLASGGPCVVGRVAFALLPQLRLGLEMELGYITLPVHALVGDRTVISFSKLWFSAGVRAGVMF